MPAATSAPRTTDDDTTETIKPQLPTVAAGKVDPLSADALHREPLVAPRPTDRHGRPRERSATSLFRLRRYMTPYRSDPVLA